MPLLGSLLGWRSIAAGLLALTMLGAAWWTIRTIQDQAARIEVLTAERDTALATANHIRRQAEAQTAALDARRQQERARADRMERSLTEILNAPPEDDGPLAPVLARVVGLREPDSTASAGGAGRSLGVLPGTGADPP